MKSKIYDEVLTTLGWFEPKVEWKPLHFVNYTYSLNKIDLTDKSNVFYYPGCFTHLHDGHKALIKSVFNNNKEAIVVISPANSDYTVSKYGKSEYATNLHRYKRIKEYIHENPDLKIVLDINPMVNFTCDHNFTDLLEHFLNRHNLSLDTMKVQPHIVCGKDRSYFKTLEKVTNKLKVYYNEGSDESSSDYIKKNPKPFEPKNLILRCQTLKEKNLFSDFFGEHYKKITPSLISEEKERVKRLDNLHKFDATCCKDYADILPYIPISRNWINPFEYDGYVTSGCLAGLKIIDSDIFSGGTKKFVESQGGSLTAVHYHIDETTELLDIDVFLDPKFNYPFTDLSYRCSLPPFSTLDHISMSHFKECLTEERLL